jgi:hypothetical protein
VPIVGLRNDLCCVCFDSLMNGSKREIGTEREVERGRGRERERERERERDEREEERREWR